MKYSWVPIVWHSILCDVHYCQKAVLCLSPFISQQLHFYDGSTQCVMEWITFSLHSCIYILVVYSYVFIYYYYFIVRMCQMKVDKKWLYLWHDMMSLVKACYSWNCAKRSRRVVIGCVMLGDWKMERSESENWSSVRASNEGLKKIDDSRNMNMKGRVKLFVFVVYTTKRERCNNNWTIPKKKVLHKELNGVQLDSQYRLNRWPEKVRIEAARHLCWRFIGIFGIIFEIQRTASV